MLVALSVCPLGVGIVLPKVYFVFPMSYGTGYDSYFDLKLFSISVGFICFRFQGYCMEPSYCELLYLCLFYLCSQQRRDWPRYKLMQCSMHHVRIRYCIQRQVATCTVLPQSLHVLFWMCWAHRTPPKTTGTVLTMMHSLSLPYLVYSLSLSSLHRCMLLAQD